MEYARLGRSEVAVSRIIFGAWVTGGWMWGGVEDEESIAAIRKAVDLGITTIDTAPVYGFGHSERIVGEAIKGRREDVVIATKCGLLRRERARERAGVRRASVSSHSKRETRNLKRPRRSASSGP